MSDVMYPAELEIIPLAKPPSATVTVPGSKSITNRALVLAALASRETACTLTGALHSEDTEVMVDCLNRLGFRVDAGWDQATITVQQNNTGRLIPAVSADLFVANSGTTMRFLVAMVSLGVGTYRLDGVQRMRERPVEDLLAALRRVGVDARSENQTGCPPVVIRGAGGWSGSRLRVRGDVSSQFLSGLLLAAAWSRTDGQEVVIEIDGPLVSYPYVQLTLEMLNPWVDEAGWLDDHSHSLIVIPDLLEPPADYPVEPDASAASYFFAAAAITGGRVTVSGMIRDLLQGDVRFVDLLAEMGCRVEECDEGITVHGGPLRGIDVDMNDISDTVMTLAAVACFAEGPTTIRNVAHIRHKETDRIAALATELRKLGAEVEERADGLAITPRPLKGCAVDTYNDHRMAMSLALIGLKVPGVVIRNPGCVAKTYPGFWQDLDKLRS
jgi:3-phosphoshikimate 1-carboxyvinyltransferase